MKAFIIDDEKHPKTILKLFLATHFPEIEVVGEADRLQEGLEAMAQMETVDVLFLDIDMPGHSGLEVRKVYPGTIDFEIIFVTAYHQYAIEAIKLSALDYLLKPLQEKEFRASILRLKERLTEKKSISRKLEILEHNLSSQQSSKLWIKTHKGSVVFLVDEILFLEAEGMYTTIHAANKKITASKPLRKILEVLPEHFFRCHRSFALNLHNLELPISIVKGKIKLSSTDWVPVSEGKKADLFRALEAI